MELKINELWITGKVRCQNGYAYIDKPFGNSEKQLIQPKRKKPIQRVTSPIKGADVVIIDEISMCRLDVFEAVVARKIYGQMTFPRELTLGGEKSVSEPCWGN